ncbi:MAG: OmpA family protein [Duncaniella sp.]|nr:OmpA family protein [Duncaniella sp.]MDE6206109.1 OmpA family protein [Duncaniella sp.]
MVVAACLWPRRASFQAQDSATYSSARGYPLRSGTIIAAIPTAVNTVVPDSAIQLATTVAGTIQPDAVVIYLFNTDSSAIPENSSLTAVAQAAHKTGKTVVVKAYTDETGRAAYNQRLSERRAKSVGDYMVAHGVPASHVKAKGYGPTHAFANNSQDRRAEITLE